MTVTCVQVAEQREGIVPNDKHTGYGTAKSKLGGVPTWIEILTLADDKVRWVYEFENEQILCLQSGDLLCLGVVYEYIWVIYMIVYGYIRA